MTALATILHVLIGLLLLAEGLNKLERTNVWKPGTVRERTAEWLRAAGWGGLTLGGAGLLVTPLMPASYIELAYISIAGGCALITVRARVRERLLLATDAGPAPDEFDRTVAIRTPAESRARAALRASMAIDRDVNRAAGQRAKDAQ